MSEPNPGARSCARLLTAVAACAVLAAVGLPTSALAQSETTTAGTPEERLYVKYGWPHVAVGALKRVTGSLSTGERGRMVLLQRYTRRQWLTVSRVRTGDRGQFTLSYRVRSLGTHKLRAKLRWERPASGASAAASRPAGRLTAYRRTHASYYGPGLYGNRLACGGRLYRSTRGVAHKSLPCGTKVTFRYRGRSVTVRVIDRGPYIAGRTWDLTAPVRRELGMPPTAVVWSNR